LNNLFSERLTRVNPIIINLNKSGIKMGVASILLVVSLPLVLSNQLFYYYPIMPTQYTQTLPASTYQLPSPLPPSMGNRYIPGKLTMMLYILNIYCNDIPCLILGNMSCFPAGPTWVTGE
jgi:hypothetical protein